MGNKLKNKAINEAFALTKKFVGKPKKMAVVIAAGGSSSRMNGINKLFAEIGETPVLAMTINAFDRSELVQEIVISAGENSIESVRTLTATYGFKKIKEIVIGGASRADSVYNGISAVSDDVELIAIHDGARPFVTDKIIESAYKGAAEYGACAPAVPVKDTIKIARNSFVGSTPDRSELFAVQTPQIFDASLIKAALYNAITQKLPITDDCSAVEALGGKIKLVEGSYENIKLTTPEDIALGEAIYKSRMTLCE